MLSAAGRHLLGGLFSLLEILPAALETVISNVFSDQTRSGPGKLDDLQGRLTLRRPASFAASLGSISRSVRKTTFAYSESSQQLCSDAPECRTAAISTGKEAVYAHDGCPTDDVSALPPQNIFGHKTPAGWNFLSIQHPAGCNGCNAPGVTSKAALVKIPSLSSDIRSIQGRSTPSSFPGSCDDQQETCLALPRPSMDGPRLV